MSPPPRLGVPDLGVGIGLRIPHYEAVLTEGGLGDTARRPTWFEIISENFFAEGGRPRANLDRALAKYRLVTHGVSMGIGSPEPLDFAYLKKLKTLARYTNTPWVSDHLCWTGAGGAHLHDLLPLPYTEESLRYVAERARVVQDFLEVRFVLENASSYLTYTSSRLTEWDFLAGIADEADIGLLFDVNNVYVSSQNHGFDPNVYVDRVPAHRVVQYHLAGHTRFPDYIIDTHTGSVCDEVWALYRRSIARTGPVSTLVEWDDEIPAFEVVWAEAEKARAILSEARAAKAAPLAAGAP